MLSPGRRRPNNVSDRKEKEEKVCLASFQGDLACKESSCWLLREWEVLHDFSERTLALFLFFHFLKAITPLGAFFEKENKVRDKKKGNGTFPLFRDVWICFFEAAAPEQGRDLKLMMIPLSLSLSFALLPRCQQDDSGSIFSLLRMKKKEYGNTHHVAGGSDDDACTRHQNPNPTLPPPPREKKKLSVASTFLQRFSLLSLSSLPHGLMTWRGRIHKFLNLI